jgi:Uma2 family endonuclease
MNVTAPDNRPFTVADLEGMPDDGKRYELIDGMLFVVPVPGWAHQEMTFSAFKLLREPCPRELRVIGGPFAVRTADDCEVQPDVLVARFVDIRSENLPVAPLLVVETMSRSTAL